MSTFAKAGFKSANYNSFRPHYPPSFYKILTEYIGNEAGKKGDKVGKTIDLGCGTGVATYPLLQFSQNVVGLDLSPPMIETANSLKAAKLKELGIQDESRIEFGVCAVEDFDAPPNSYDLITAAECIHWFKDYPKFFEAAAKHLKPNGVLAYWFYVDPVVVNFEGPHNEKMLAVETMHRAQQIYLLYVYEDPKGLGVHWDRPGRDILRNLLREVDAQIPQDLFRDVKTQKYVPSVDGLLQLTPQDLRLVREKITLKDFTNYISTYSLFHNYSESTGAGAEFLEKMIQEFETELGWDREKTLLDLNWTSGYTFMRKSGE